MNVGAESFSYSFYSKWVEFSIQLAEVPFEIVSNNFQLLLLFLSFGYKPGFICQNRSLFIYSSLQNFEISPLNLGVYFTCSFNTETEIRTCLN